MIILQSYNMLQITYSKNKENTLLITSKTCLTKDVKIKNTKRTMFRITMSHVPTRGISPVTTITTRAYTRGPVKFQPKSQAAKDQANDSTGTHTHVADKHCTMKDCGNIKCKTLCGPEEKIKVLGHHTHKPPIGRFMRLISEEDATGASRNQYFVKTNKETVISQKEKQTYGNQMKDDIKQEPFITKNIDKYD